MLVDEDFEHNSLYRTLATKFGVPLVEADQELEAGLASAEDAQLLQIAIGSAVLYTRRTPILSGTSPLSMRDQSTAAISISSIHISDVSNCSASKICFLRW